MDATTVVQRKKLGRPPKAASTLKAAENNPVSSVGGGGVAFVQTELGDEAALVAISPIPDEQASVEAPAGAMDTSAECRRSSRKKIIKFDVRDLLNKHRKPHKIQIEARIDSNAPSVSTKTLESAVGDSDNSGANNREKCFIEKTSIIQRSAFEHLQHGPTQVPIPLKTQIFKPNQASSMIVAQMESISSTNQSIHKQPKSIAYTAGINRKLNTTEVVVPKRRGRPPKNRSLIEKPVIEETKCELNKEMSIVSEQSKDLAMKPLPTKSEFTAKLNVVATPATSFQIQFEKSLYSNKQKELSELSLKSYDESEKKEPFNISEKCEENITLAEVKPISVESFEKSSLKPDSKEVSGLLQLESSTSTSLISSMELGATYEISSNKDIMQEVGQEKLESIETENNIVDIEEKLYKEKQIIDCKSPGSSNITLPIKKQLSKLQELQAEVVANESAKDSAIFLNEEINLTSTEISATKDKLTESDGTRKTSTPTPQRSERRSGRRLGDGSNKTLEETFAEIAANSSKAILDKTIQKDENSLSETLPESEEISTQSMQLELNKGENVTPLTATQAMPNEDESSRSLSPKEGASDPEVVPIKRRGRKPKPKLVFEKEDCLNESITLEQDITDIQTLESHVQDSINVNVSSLSHEEVVTSSNKSMLTVHESESYTEKPLIDQKAQTEENQIQATDFKSVASSSQLTENIRSSEEKSHDQKARKKERLEERSPSKKSSSHHKHRKHEDYKADLNTSKHKSSSLTKMKKHKDTDNDEAARNDRKSMEATKKLKLLSKESFGDAAVPKKSINSTLERSKKYKEETEDGDVKKGPAKKLTALLLENSPLQSSQHVSTPTTSDNTLVDDVRNTSSLGKENPENDESVNKGSYLMSRERSAVDSLKKSALLSPERSLDESNQKEKPESVFTENSVVKSKESFIENVRKQPTAIKDKLSSEGFKKTTSTSKEKISLESYSRKPSSSFSSSKEKHTEESTKKPTSTPDERHKKSIHISKEKLVEDYLKKPNSTTKERAAAEGLGKIENASDFKFEKRQHDKKKQKLKSIDNPLSTSKSSSKMQDYTQLSTKTSSSGKTPDSKSHKRKRKHKESPEIPPRSQENVEKIPKATESKEENKLHKKELKEAKKQARKERQKKLTEAFEAAMEENPEQVKKPQPEMQAINLPQKEPMTTEADNEIGEIILPPTPGESDASIDVNDDNDAQKPFSPIEQCAQATEEEKPATVVESDPLYDIEKFIEAGVNLLKRDYKLAEDDVEIKTEGAAADLIKSQSTKESTEESSITVENIDAKNDLSSALDFYETPASTPANVTPSSSPTPNDNSVDTYYYSDGVRRSHRLKKITNAPKALVGRGLVRDRDRERLAMRDDVETKSYYSIEDHLMDLAEVEAKNAKFLKEMEERLSNFEVIKENEYHCERVVSREARKMVCDCFLTPEESERGELGCGEDCLNRLLMIECSAHCKVGERCTNKRFQKYLCAPCRVFRTEKKGFGIMADVEIHPGEFIMEYVGEVLDSDEFEDRRVAYSQDKNRHYYFMALRSDAIIDATIKGNVSRFINHSCDPNAETQKWTVNGELRIGFFSRKTIMPGEEITFDYQYQRYGREAQRCYCESANCRGWIGEEPASDEGEQVDDDEDDDDDEYDEDESDVVSMVKGLMSVEDVEDEDGKDDIMSEETRRNIQDAAVKAQLRKNQTEKETNAIKEPGLDGETDESKQKFMAYLSKISAKIEMHKKSVREEKKRKRQQRKQAASERRPPTAATTRFLEDPDLEDEIDFLSRCGLKNQSDTLRLSRLMVRAKLVPTRLNLLAILRAGELACRRLFLDYHGLHLLHGWINEDGRMDMSIRIALLETLECLPIPNKTLLTDSKVYQAIRNWCKGVKADGSSSSPSDDSSKESAAEKQTTTEVGETAVDDNESTTSELEKLALKLLNSWDNLPEIFRIPKRERIEQMKEHEREADRQYAATVEADQDEDDQKELSTDRYQRDRFERRFGRPQGARTITVLGAGAIGMSSKRLISSDVLSPEDTKHLSKEQRRELFAAKVARDEAEKRQAERRREFETKCTFFGLDPLITRQEDIPFCVSDSGKWYNEHRQLINTPPAFAHVQTPMKPMSTNPTDYYLPSAATKLPPEWTYAITEQGKIYYYHLKHRVPQWEPPTPEQINKTKWSDGESESDENDIEGARELSEEKIKEIEAIETQEDLNAYLKKTVQEQRQLRYKRLVEERPISPRREEDRIYNQIEMRKYKENKEKIKKRKEEIRRRRSEAIKNSMLNMCTLGSLDIKPTSTAAAGLNFDTNRTNPESSDMPDDALPIQDYLLSSDEDNEDIEEMKAECNNSPLLDKIVQGDKIVDELDALTTKRQLKRPLPPHRDFNFDMNMSGNINSESLLASIEKLEQKKRKQEKKEKSKRSKESSDAKYRKLKEKFRCEIAGIIVQHLKPYRKDSCIFGRIRSNEDFNHLAKKLTHFVMIKELKYCESVGQTLVVTESVKNKSREFIRKYMAKYEAGYVKPNNDPEFKDIPYTL